MLDSTIVVIIAADCLKMMVQGKFKVNITQVSVKLGENKLHT